MVQPRTFRGPSLNSALGVGRQALAVAVASPLWLRGAGLGPVFSDAPRLRGAAGPGLGWRGRDPGTERRRRGWVRTRPGGYERSGGNWGGTDTAAPQSGAAGPCCAGAAGLRGPPSPAREPHGRSLRGTSGRPEGGLEPQRVSCCAALAACETGGASSPAWNQVTTYCCFCWVLCPRLPQESKPKQKKPRDMYFLNPPLGHGSLSLRVWAYCYFCFRYLSSCCCCSCVGVVLFCFVFPLRRCSSFLFKRSSEGDMRVKLEGSTSVTERKSLS